MPLLTDRLRSKEKLSALQKVSLFAPFFNAAKVSTSRQRYWYYQDVEARTSEANKISLPTLLTERYGRQLGIRPAGYRLCRIQ
jgi:hypothetical protein